MITRSTSFSALLLFAPVVLLSAQEPFSSVIENKIRLRQLTDIEQYIIQNIMHINDHNQSKYLRPTALHVAATYNNVNVASLLLKHGANINSVDINGDTPLHVACYAGNLDVAKLLIDKGTNPNVKNLADETPLYQAASHLQPALVELLLKHGADKKLGTKIINETPLQAVKEYRPIGNREATTQQEIINMLTPAE